MACGGLLLGLLVASSSLWADPTVEVRVYGLEGNLLENVEAALTLPAGLVQNGNVNEHWLKRYEAKLPQLVGEALKPFGYFDSQTAVVTERVNDKRILLRVSVEPGPPVLVAATNLDIRGPGADNQELRSLIRDFPLRPSDQLRQDKYEKSKAALRTQAIALGYLDAQFARHAIRVDTGTRQAEIELILDTGPRYRFGQVRMDGAPRYPERFLRRYLAFQPGHAFSHAKLGQTQLNFLNSDRFRDVSVTPQMEQAVDLNVPVQIQLTPLPRLRLRPGIGYGTDTGARLSLRCQNINLLGRGHEQLTELMVAEKRQSLQSSYIVPSRRKLEDYHAWRLGYKRDNPDSYDSSSLSAEAEWVRAFSSGLSGSLFVRLLHESFTIGDDREQSRMVIPGVRLTRRRYSDPIRPKRGDHFSLEARGASQALGSDVSLLQFLGSGTILKNLPARLSLQARLQAATTLRDGDPDEIPASMRFFAGGDQSVRGYAYQSLSPKDDDGDPVGGAHQLVASLELERAIGDHWGVAIFFDAGNAFDSLSDYTLAKGVGIGCRYYTRIGPIRVDLARQLGVDDPSVRLHLSMGYLW